MHALYTVYEWLRVPTTANHSLRHTLCASTRTLRMPMCVYARLTHTLHMSTHALRVSTHALHASMRALQVYDWLRVPTTANQITDI